MILKDKQYQTNFSEFWRYLAISSEFWRVLALRVPLSEIYRHAAEFASKKCNIYGDLEFAVPVRRAYTERMKNQNWIEDWAKQYETNSKLPEQKIPCSVEGCETKTTCFSSNLHGRVAEHEGGIRGLLKTFKCRGCRSKIRIIDMPASSSEAPRKRVAKKTTKAATKQSRVEELNQAARSAMIDVNAVPVRYNFNDPESVRQLTEGTCHRPDIYLDNDRACDGCDLYEHCACNAKQLLADSGRKKAVAGPRRKK